MQIDMHYYGTYAMAAAAGIPRNDAEIVAHASQYVDDQDHEELRSVRTVNGDTCEAVIGIATAHSPYDISADVGLMKSVINKLTRHPMNSTADDSRLVWVPFHFLPGGGNGKYLERIMCKRDSQIAQEMIDHHIKQKDEKFNLQLLGIAAHVYADTFSHFGFSGTTSSLNQVEKDTISLDGRTSSKMQAMLWNVSERIKTGFANNSGLGHGGVDTLPDMPFLKWEFEHALGYVDKRDNTVNFLEACRRLHDHFTCFANEKGYSTPRISFDEIASTVENILCYEGDNYERSDQWKVAMKNGHLGPVELCKDYNSRSWTEELIGAMENRNATSITSSSAYLFHTAAEYHRHYVLKRLLPAHQVIVA
ncbi:DUF6765 family protein [Chromobacterium vaccinii]|uniref:DUF6765 family protein n=1 Tax=Chromobacterium vaccinii TaxID=1108595 RepID=UPI0031DF0F1A